MTSRLLPICLVTLVGCDTACARMDFCSLHPKLYKLSPAPKGGGPESFFDNRMAGSAPYKSEGFESFTSQIQVLPVVVVVVVVRLSIWVSRLEIAEFPDSVHRSAP